MNQLIQLNSGSPELHLLKVIVECLKEGAVIAYPTDSGYALGAKMGLERPLDRICALRNLDKKHHFTLMCRDIAEISKYAQVSNANFRVLKRSLPGGFTFILPASLELLKRLTQKRKTVGVRIPEHPVPIGIVEMLGEPLLSTTLILPGQTLPLVCAQEVGELLSNRVDLVIDSGYCGFEPTSVVDLTGEGLCILRQGTGDVSSFL